MTPARGDELDGTARLPKDAIGLGIALVGFALAILAADVARGVALGIHVPVLTVFSIAVHEG